MRKTIAFILAAALLLTLPACAKKVEEPAPQEVEYTYTPPEPKVGFQVALLVCGELENNALFLSAEDGLKQLQDEKRITLDTIELGQPSEGRENWLKTLDETAKSKKYNVIVCGTPAMAEVVREAAYNNPRQMFVLFDDCTYSGENLNVLNLCFKNNEIGYLLGIIAARLTANTELDCINENPVIGFIGGGRDSADTNDYLVGYIEGALSVNPDIRVDTRYLNDETAPARSKEYALSMIEHYHCDVIWNVAGAPGEGCQSAALETGAAWLLGNEYDMEAYAPKELAARIFTSGLKNIGASLVWLFNEIDAGREYWGYEVRLGLAQGCIGIVTDKNFEKLARERTKTLVENAQAKILDGTAELHTMIGNSDNAMPDLSALRTSVRPK